MRELLQKSQKHLLWKDEAGSQFVLLRGMEIYRFSQTLLKCLIFSKTEYTKLAKIAPNLNAWRLDDGLYVCSVDVSKFTEILKTVSVPRRRIYIHGKRIAKLEELLGHRIFKCGWREEAQ